MVRVMLGVKFGDCWEGRKNYISKTIEEIEKRKFIKPKNIISLKRKTPKGKRPGESMKTYKRRMELEK